MFFFLLNKFSTNIMFYMGSSINDVVFDGGGGVYGQKRRNTTREGGGVLVKTASYMNNFVNYMLMHFSRNYLLIFSEYPLASTK